ncbi:MAG: helix-turn-helix transcriptional regulator [Phycisphaerales bacterium]|nr:helix-turn-helix transcriptional regulator [Phycisphaerales bacterium]
MAKARRKTQPIGDLQQLRVLTSAVAHEIIQSLRDGGPATVAELGPRLGRKANSLHYHVRKLVDAGFLHQVGAHRSHARTEAIYDVTAIQFEGPSAPLDKDLRDATNDVVASLLRHATRNFAQASEVANEIVESGKRRNLCADRYTAWLSNAQLAEVNKHLNALRAIFSTGSKPGEGQLCMLTTVLTPLKQP